MNKISIIILAAGSSRRFGGNKLLTIVAGKPLFQHVIDTLVDIHVDEKIVVTKYEEIAEYARTHNIQVVYNHSDLEICSSIKMGVEAANRDNDYMFLNADTPYLQLHTIVQLIDVHRCGHKAITCSTYQGEIKQPNIFRNQFRNALVSLTHNTGGKQIIKQHLQDIQCVELTYKECFDIDTRADIQKLEGE